MIEKIKRLKKEKNALIIAHYYVDGELQDLADYVGDSYGMALFARDHQADLAIICGVKFMGETFKVMNPDQKICMPDLNAGCSLADSCTPQIFEYFKNKHPNSFVMTYINSSLEIKAMSDVIVTSSNAVKIAEQVPQNQNIIFGPDQHLGRYISKKLGRDMTLFPGNCFVHTSFSSKEMNNIKAKHPNAKLIAHPECEEVILDQADYIGSTSQLLEFTQKDSAKEFIVMTEAGILHQMQKASPDKTFLMGPDLSGCSCNECPHMKLNSLEKLLDCLENETGEVTVDPVLAAKGQIAGEDVSGKKFLEHCSPSDTNRVVTRWQDCSEEDAQKACEVLAKSGKHWSEIDSKQRVLSVRKAADLMRKKRFTLIQQICLEVGKGVESADADVTEAIDFCEYYAALYENLSAGKPLGVKTGEDNRYIYEARGVAVVLAPWNFPLAILCGMAVGPLVCGCPVILKPAEQSSGVAWLFYQILLEAGVSEKALAFLPGRGEVVGAALVDHPLVHVINFTGSRDVGLQIIQKAAVVKKGQRHIKKVVAEMGGKNAAIVDEGADLDGAVQGALDSAFGFAGQKCSALSRLIVLEGIYEEFKERFVEAVQSLRVGEVSDFGAQVGPVIDEESYERLKKVISKHKKSILVQAPIDKDLVAQGYFVAPTVFESDDPQSELGQAEFFGPLVTLFKAKNIDEALRIANDVDYALTGGLFSRHPGNIDEVKKRFEVGNLYINRSITGALVHRQPFGGFKLSGCGGKAGGPDYLLNFLEPRTITENTMRCGFTPEI